MNLPKLRKAGPAHITPGDSKPTPPVSKWVVLFTALVGGFLTAFTVSSVTIALPSIGEDLSMDAVLLSWVVTVYPLTAAALLVPFGRLADILGRKKLYATGMITYTTASIFIGFSQTAWVLLGFRVMQGIGASMLFTTSVALISSAFPSSERGKALGIHTATVYLGTSVGPFVGGLLTQHFGWRSIFAVTVSLGIVSITLVLTRLKVEWAEAKGQHFDIKGSVIYSIGLIAVVYGLSELPSVTGAWILGLGIVGGLAFVRWEMRVPSPILDISLFRTNRVFLFSNIAALTNFAATFAVTFLLSLYLQYNKGFAPQNAGLVILSMPVVQAMISPLAGRTSDKIEPRVVATAGMIATTVGLGLLTFLSETTPIAYIVAALAILGIGFALFASPNTNAIMSSVDRTQYGVAAAMVATARQVGFTLSMAIAALVLAMHIGRVEITPEYYPGVLASAKTSFAIFATLCGAGIFASMARGKVRR